MLEIFVKSAKDLTGAENAQIDQASSLAYAGDTAPDIGWSESQWFVLGRLDGRIVSLVGVLYRDVLVGGQPVPVGGVGGVATHPDFQRLGYAGQLMEKTGAFLRDGLTVDFGMLFCSPERLAYYAKFGWLQIDAPLFYHHRGERHLLDHAYMVLPVRGLAWPEGEIDLQGGPW